MSSGERTRVEPTISSRSYPSPIQRRNEKRALSNTAEIETAVTISLPRSFRAYYDPLAAKFGTFVF